MLKSAAKILSFLLLLPVWLYRWIISPWTPASCRHVPTCSRYTIDALRLHGPFRGIMISADRILRCRPGGTHGYDPVPMFIFRRYRGCRSLLCRAPRCNRLKDHD
ncbi:MAG TPA: membrane protein insertion efficiency factor YidD [Bacteroidales bacterium]|nr:membrane protein insertion efficiency factor YidD [Bacteroidales bacterium]MDI9533422.1 membrane protein insertion efficiency factor YidD [Bacteroidota bacterium]OPZ58010.1 MAG: putative membrane protein insertion efficiency factor [Bacteroidetes bacterium ADurb.BinA012]MBK7732772.1 membrane protein insertion efficiency factor YidD [Bacteroidales bacterium]MBP7035907.1 membrane protein insertion efficiency factor YidD [Bacteroidales bacterium]